MTLTDTLPASEINFEASPFDDARAQLRDATTLLGYDDGMYAMLIATD